MVGKTAIINPADCTAVIFLTYNHSIEVGTVKSAQSVPDHTRRAFFALAAEFWRELNDRL
jgi:hypothetical protein